MKCEHCSAPLAENRRFCLSCGTRYPDPPEDPAPAQASQQPDWEAEAAGTVWEAPHPPAQIPALKLPTRRSLPKMIFMGILTLMIYPLVIWCRLPSELNIAASRHDGKRTVSFFGMLLLAPVTLGIYPLVWIHGFCGRIGRELARRGIEYRFGARDFWLWGVLGMLILVGPFVYLCRLLRAMNKINAHFNVNG